MRGRKTRCGSKLRRRRWGYGSWRERPGGSCWTIILGFEVAFSIWYRQNPTQQGISQTHSLSPGSGGPQQQSAEFVTSSQARTYQLTNNTKNQDCKITKMRTSLGPFIVEDICPSVLVGLPSVSNSSLSPYLTHNYPPRYFPPPILEILSDQTLEAARRSELITTA